MTIKREHRRSSLSAIEELLDHSSDKVRDDYRDKSLARHRNEPASISALNYFALYLMENGIKTLQEIKGSQGLIDNFYHYMEIKIHSAECKKEYRKELTAFLHEVCDFAADGRPLSYVLPSRSARPAWATVVTTVATGRQTPQRGSTFAVVVQEIVKETPPPAVPATVKEIPAAVAETVKETPPALVIPVKAAPVPPAEELPPEKSFMPDKLTVMLAAATGKKYYVRVEEEAIALMHFVMWLKPWTHNKDVGEEMKGMPTALRIRFQKNIMGNQSKFVLVDIGVFSKRVDAVAPTGERKKYLTPEFVALFNDREKRAGLVKWAESYQAHRTAIARAEYSRRAQTPSFG